MDGSFNTVLNAVSENAEDAVAKQEAQVSANIGHKSVAVIDNILFLDQVRGGRHEDIEIDAVAVLSLEFIRFNPIVVVCIYCKPTNLDLRSVYRSSL